MAPLLTLLVEVGLELVEQVVLADDVADVGDLELVGLEVEAVLLEPPDESILVCAPRIDAALAQRLLLGNASQLAEVVEELGGHEVVIDNVVWDLALLLGLPASPPPPTWRQASMQVPPYIHGGRQSPIIYVKV